MDIENALEKTQEETRQDIIVHTGTYEGSILGFYGTIKSQKNLYAFTPNRGALKCIKAHKKYLFTGGFDEILRIYDVNKKKEIGELNGHEGTINCIESFGNFVFTGADDGLIIMWRVQEWSHLLTLKGHKKAVNDMAIHSSGKIMASVGADKKLILWNLMKGTKIFRKTYDVSLYRVLWSNDGNYFIVMSDNDILILDQNDNQIVKKLTHPCRLNDIALYEDILSVAGDNGYVYLWNNVTNIEATSYHLRFIAHTPRTKKLRYVQYRDKNLLVTCSTDGTVRFWEMNIILPELQEQQEDKDLQSELKFSYNITTHQRIISLEAAVRDHLLEIESSKPAAGENEKAKNKKKKKKKLLEGKLNGNSKKIKKVRIQEQPEAHQPIAKLKKKRQREKEKNLSNKKLEQNSDVKNVKNVPKTARPKSILKSAMKKRVEE